jgi:hypothetical protein
MSLIAAKILKKESLMFKGLFFSFVLIFSVGIFAYDFEESEEHSSCVLSISTKMLPGKSKDESGKAVIEATLKDKSGNPISGKEIQFNASWGSFLCVLPDSNTVVSYEDRGCFTTDANGKSKVYLVNLKMNSTINVKATCDCGGYSAYANGSLTMKTYKKKTK